MAALFALGVLLVAQLVILSKLRAIHDGIRYLRNVSNLLFDLDASIVRLKGDLDHLARVVLEGQAKPSESHNNRFNEVLRAISTLDWSLKGYRGAVESQIRDIRGELRGPSRSDEGLERRKITWKELKELIRASDKGTTGVASPENSPETAKNTEGDA